MRIHPEVRLFGPGLTRLGTIDSLRTYALTCTSTGLSSRSIVPLPWRDRARCSGSALLPAAFGLRAGSDGRRCDDGTGLISAHVAESLPLGGR